MLTYKFRPRLIRQTIADIEGRLAPWIDWLCSSHYLVFGDDPGPVYEIEDELVALIHQLDKLQFQFDRSNIDFATIRAYRTALDSFYRASELVTGIRTQDRGSPEFTQKILRLLTECRGRLRQLETFADQEGTADQEAIVGI